jgi:aryl-alcohol dehydrogenase-like predicted oxidoreductase
MLTGKYTRANHAESNPRRGGFVTRAFTEESFRVVDVLIRVADQLGTTPARAALAWVRSQPGVASTIIGARTAEQLDDNLGALEVQLAPEQAKALEEVSRPKLNFPFDFVQNSSGFGHSGAIVNGVEAPVNPLSPKNDSERY